MQSPAKVPEHILFPLRKISRSPLKAKGRTLSKCLTSSASVVSLPKIRPLRANLITPPMTNLRNLPKVTTHSRQGSARRPILPTQLPAKRAPKMGQLPTRKLPTRQRARIRILPRISRSSSQFPKRPPCCSSAIKMEKRLLRLLPSKQARRKLSKRPALL